jgi:hypothetical protein
VPISLSYTTPPPYITHGQPSVGNRAEGNLTSCLNFDFAFLNCLTPRLCSLIDGPEVEHLSYTTPPPCAQCKANVWPAAAAPPLFSTRMRAFFEAM